MWSIVKEPLLIGTLNIGLPTTDVVTDGVLIYKLFGGVPYHPNCSYHFSYNTTESEVFATCLAGIPEEEL